MRYILILLIILLVGCSPKINKKLNLIGKDLEKIQVLLRNLDQPAIEVNKALRQKMIFDELKKVNKLFAKEAECNEWYIWGIAPYTFKAAKYCEKPGLKQSDIDKNKNNQLQ